MRGLARGPAGGAGDRAERVSPGARRAGIVAARSDGPHPALPHDMTIPCRICGYHAPLPECPHCGGKPSLPSLAQPARGAAAGVLAGVSAVPVGLWLLATTRGVKRWLVPPLLLTLAFLVAALWTGFAWLRRAAGGVLPEHVHLAGWKWLERALDLAYRAGTSGPLYWLVAFLLGSLVAWYAFSVVYEALAGPFLDEVQGRFERRWFGADPRSRLERPSDIPEERCFWLTLAASAGAAALLLAGFFAPGVPFLAALI